MRKDYFSFVVHKHDATRLHYDFRLEIGDGMPSWSIPKGPTLDNTVKRLAMRTPDHDVDYRNFEGVIPEGTYGAGPVMIWDEGTYTPEKEIEKGVREVVTDNEKGMQVMQEGLTKGELKFTLHGTKLKGSFALVKTRGFGKNPKETWLLIKHNDAYVQKGYDAKKDDVSARSGQSMDEIRHSV